MAAAQFGSIVVEQSTQRVLAGVGNDGERAWVYPLCTPMGHGVTQESAFDHTFHRSIFVGQGPIESRGVRSNFWVLHRDFRYADHAVYNDLGEIRYVEPPSCQRTDLGFRFTYESTWLDSKGEALLDETRTVDVWDGGDATLCEVRSSKRSAYDDVVYPATKHGSIGVRVQQQLLPAFGGEIVGVERGQMRRGLADDVASGKQCEAVLYEADVPRLGVFGVAMAVADNSAATDRCGPWFIRDYGLAMFDATMNEDLVVRRGGAWSAALRVAAYDGVATVARVAQWRASGCG
jgi:Methane oxygenase PmoA